MRRPGEQRTSEWQRVTDTYRTRWGLESLWRHVEGKDGVTVFETDEGDWKWVFQGEFSEPFYSAEDAMDDAEDALGLE